MRETDEKVQENGEDDEDYADDDDRDAMSTRGNTNSHIDSDEYDDDVCGVIR